VFFNVSGQNFWNKPLLLLTKLGDVFSPRWVKNCHGQNHPRLLMMIGGQQSAAFTGIRSPSADIRCSV